MYIVESEDLHRRLSGDYRNPGPSQQTSMRINALLPEHFGTAGIVLPAIATAATVVVDDHERPPELSTGAGALLAESAALVQAQAARHVQIANLG